MTRPRAAPAGLRPRETAASAPGARLVVVGLGNIGSPLVPLLARQPGVRELVLVDRDRYDASNLGTQDITTRDLGRPKAWVQARRARAVNPALQVTAWHAPVEELPAGALDGDLVLAGLDSLRGRQVVHETAWRLGVPLIDAGVRPDLLLVRVSTFQPAPEAPCLECAWSAADYQRLERRYPCRGGREETAPTAGPPQLGALAASLLALEAVRFLETPGAYRGGKSLILDAAHHNLHALQEVRKPGCRFDHRTRDIVRLAAGPARLSLRDLLDRLPRPGVERPREWRMAVQGSPLVRALTCQACLATTPCLALFAGAGWHNRRCAACGGPLVPAGLDFHDALPLNLVPATRAGRPLSRLGLRPGELLTLLGPDRERSFLLGSCRTGSVRPRGRGGRGEDAADSPCSPALTVGETKE